MAISPLTRFFHVSILRKNVDLSKMTLRGGGVISGGGVLLPNTLVGEEYLNPSLRLTSYIEKSAFMSILK